MKRRFTGALIKGLVKEKGFTLLPDEYGELVIDSKINILAKESKECLAILELIDADALTEEEIAARLQDNGTKLTNIRDTSYTYIFEVFIFDSEPGADKVRVIESGQIHSVMAKRFLKSMSVNLSSYSIQKHFTAPFIDFGIENQIRAQFQNDYQNEAGIDELKSIQQQRTQELKLEFKVKTPVLTYTLIAINILVFGLIYLYSFYSGSTYDELLFQFGAKENIRILAGEYWRFITPVFLHANIMHLLVNCYSLNAVGVIIERLFGHRRFAVIYFIAGVLGNIASFMFSTNPGVGASGAIFGLMGAILYFGVEKPSQFKAYFRHGVIVTLVINLVYGFSNPRIDNFAHLGGLVGGFFAAGIVGLTAVKCGWYLNRYLYIAVTLVLALLGLLYGFNNTQNRILPKLSELERLDKAQSWVESERLGEEILAMGPRRVDIKVKVLWSVTRAEALSGKYNEALEHAQVLTSIDAANGHYLQGVLYFEMRQFDKAKEELLHAKELGAKYDNIDELVRQAEEALI